MGRDDEQGKDDQAYPHTVPAGISSDPEQEPFPIVSKRHMGMYAASCRMVAKSGCRILA